MAPVALEPIELVDAYYAAWIAGDVGGAMALVSDEFTSSVGDRAATTGYMSYVAAVGREIAIYDCSSTRNGLSDVVTCEVEQVDPLADALELLVSRVKHTVTDGKLTEVKFSDTYMDSDFHLGSYARAIDPAGYEAACASGAETGVLAANAVKYTEACGTYLADLADAAAADILARAAAAEAVDPIALVVAFYEAWGDGDIGTATSFLSPRVTSPAGREPGLGLARLRNYMEYIKAIPQSIAVDDCEAMGSLVTCHVEFRDPVIDALGIKGSMATHEIELGLISHVALAAQYFESDTAVAEYLRDNGGGEFETACAAPGDGSAKGELGLAFNETCGAFVAQHIADAAATL